jgi:hypothetical protein
VTDQPEPLRPRAERCPDPNCTDEQQCWRCDAEESQHALIASMSRCPECGTPVPPTHWTKHLQRHHPQASAATARSVDQPHPTDCQCVCDGCRHHNAYPVPEPRKEYRAAIEAAIGLNVDCGGSEGVHRVRDAVLAVRDLELDQARASREQWRREVRDLAEQVKTLVADRAALLDRILADAHHHEGCLLEPNADGGISHSSIAAGLRIAAQHITATLEPPKEQP